MLLGTDLSITEIADRLGFDDPAHIARYFRKATGTTPTAYRRKHARR
jgi:AraC-like DNA-binding protein